MNANKTALMGGFLMGSDMSAVVIGIAAVVIYSIGIFMGLWIGRSKSSRNTNNPTSGASLKPPPKHK